MNKRVLSIVLAVLLVLTSVPFTAIADERDKITITAESGTAMIAIIGADGPDPNDPGIIEEVGKISLIAGMQKINRDYSQTAIVTVANGTDSPVMYFLDRISEYDDIALNFVEGGSIGEPTVILGGETQEVLLTIFAQNATRASYNIPVTLYVVENGVATADATATLTLDVPTVELNLSILQTHLDKDSLTHTYSIRNNGSAISDLTLSLRGDVADYAHISPGVENYAMKASETLSGIEIVPDLAKLKENGMKKVSGRIVAQSGGSLSFINIDFDTQGKDITIITLGQLALKQDNNEYWNLDLVQNSAEVHKEVFEEEEFEFIMSYALEYGLNEILPVTVEMSGEIYTGDAGEFEDIFDSVENPDGSTTIHIRTLMNKEVYNELVGISPEMSMITPFGITGNHEADLIIDISLTLGGRYIPGLKDFAEGAEAFLTGYSVGETLTSGGRFKCVMASTNLSATEKASYTTIKVAQTGLLIIGIAGLFIPGAQVPAGLAIASAVAGYAGDKANSFVEGRGNCGNNETAITNSMLGYQCTNVGRISSSFYVPNYGQPTTAYSSGRMYQDESGNYVKALGSYYIDTPDFTFTNSINGQAFGRTQGANLARISFTEIPVNLINPGRVNILERRFNTNPGHAFINAATEVTLVYPSNRKIGYIGSPDSLNEVRALPDLAVYAENIFVAEGLIVGDDTQLYVNFYNRGSSGAWAEVEVFVNDVSIYKDSKVSTIPGIERDYRYVPMFSEDRIVVDWKPTQIENTIRVELTSMGGIQERIISNNMATRTLIARERQIPIIGSVIPSVIYLDNLNVSDLFLLSVDLTNTVDLQGVRFTIGDAEPIEATITRTANGVRASANIPIPKPGDYRATVTANYYTGGYTINSETVIYNTGFVAKDSIITVEPSRKLHFKVEPPNAAGLAYYLWRIDGGAPEETGITVRVLPDGTRESILTQEVMGDITKYYLVVTGIINDVSCMALALLEDVLNGAVTKFDLSTPISPLFVELALTLSGFNTAAAVSTLNEETVYGTDFFGKISISDPKESSYVGGDIVSFKIHELFDAYGIAYAESPYRLDLFTPLSRATFTLKDVLTDKTFTLPILAFNSDTMTFNVALPSSADISGAYTFGVELEQLIPKWHEIKVTAGIGGSVTGGGEFVSGTQITLIASPDVRYAFDGWYEEDERINKDAAYSFKVEADRKLEARFTLVTSSSGGGGGGNTNAAVSPTKADYVRRDGKDISFVLISDSHRLLNLKNGDIILSPSRDYIVDGNTISIKSEYLASLGFGQQVITITMSGGTNPTFTVTIIDGNELDLGTPQPVPTTEEPEFEFDESTKSLIPFLDVQPGAWYYNNVVYVYENELMNGTASDRFSPELGVTRGMVVTVLYRLYGVTEVFDGPFVDVEGGMYYTEAVNWAAANDVAMGYGNNYFGPDDLVTREQLAAIIYRYQQLSGKIPAVKQSELVFIDGDKINEYAIESVYTLVRQGIINGKPGNLFEPQENTTRAEFAAMLHRYAQ